MTVQLQGAQTANTPSPLVEPPKPRLSPVDTGAAQRQSDELARMQRDDFPAYVQALGQSLSPEDRENPFAYSLGADVPIEVKRQVWAEYQSGQNAPRVEIGSLGGTNATYTERDGTNGTIRINSDLITGDPSRRGQMEAFAVWGHMEEVGHWADARAQTLMGRTGGDSLGDEGARYALLATNTLSTQFGSTNPVATYDIPASNGTQRVDVDTVVLRTIGATKLNNGSFARENRIDGVENFGPEGHYQTTYITAIGAGNALGMAPAEVDRAANRMALGSQLPDMLENYDAFSQFKNQFASRFIDSQRSPFNLGEPMWSAADQRHLESVYEGLHALPRNENATLAWQGDEHQQTAAFIRDRIVAGDYVTAGVAIHRYGDLSAHVRPNGLPYSGDIGHGLAGHTPDYLYTERDGLAQPWSKAIDYQSSLSTVIADGLAARHRALGGTVSLTGAGDAANAARTTWRTIYDSSLTASRSQQGWFTNGADAGDATETWFRETAGRFIQVYHDRAGGPYQPLMIGETGMGGGYNPSSGDIRSLDTVMNRFDAIP